MYPNPIFKGTAQCRPHNPNGNCWVPCKGKGGKCDACGTDGYCCKRGSTDCPSNIANVAHNRHHSCVTCKDIGSYVLKICPNDVQLRKELKSK